MEKVGRTGVLKTAAALLLGFGHHAFGACQVIWSNYTVPANASTCYEIWGSNITFNGNNKKITGTSAQTSNTIIAVKGINVTVKNVEINCNTKLTGIDFENAGASKAEGIRISNCYYGVWKKNTGLSVTGVFDGGSNMMNNFFDVLSNDGTSKNIYTADVDAYANGGGYGLYATTSPFYDYRSIVYAKNFGVIAAENSFFWMNQSQLSLNSHHDLYLYSVAAAYLTNVLLGSGAGKQILNYNSNVIKN
jgi:hypothetical protein